MRQRSWDIVGICATSACAIHCFILPAIIPVLPLLGLQWIAQPGFESTVLAISIAIASYALLNGYRHYHGQMWPLACALVGFLLYAFKGGLGEQYEPWILSGGALLIVFAHSMNLRLRLKIASQ